VTNLYFDTGDYTALTRHSLGRAESVNAIFSAVEVGFDQLPTPTEIKQSKVTFVATDTGAANAYLVSLTYAPASYSDGLEVVFRVGNTNTSTATINVNSLGVKSIRNYAGTALSGGELVQGALVTLRYDNTNGYFRITSPVTTVGSVTGIDINGLTQASEVDTAADFVPIYDASAGGHRKVLPSLIADEGNLCLAAGVFAL